MRWHTSSAKAGPRAYRLIVPLLAAWLAVWVVLSWAAIQDDALIHLRYADNLYLHHYITYDGLHPNYGASSLLYVALLAVLRAFTASPQLPRAVSTIVHLLLFGGLALALGLRLPRQARVARIAGLVLLALLATPSAVRWLEDGMETGLVLSVVTLIACMLHGWVFHYGTGSSPARPIWLGGVAFLAVMLRTELLLLCGVGLLISILEHRRRAAGRDVARRLEAPVLSHSPNGTRSTDSIAPIVAIAAGSAVAVAAIFSAMHVLLPDTAVAKSHGIAHWFNPIHDTAITLAGAFSFGTGLFAFWLLTLGIVAVRRGLTLSTVLANCLCPVVLALSSLRGQEIQGVRYFAWTFTFSIVWNVLELAKAPDSAVEARGNVSDRGCALLLYCFAGLLLGELPFESVAMHRVLTTRSKTMQVFESQNLRPLAMRRGVASDIGYIGYFTGAQICDLAGLVNGREAARLNSKERVSVCAQTNPEFMFLNSSQYGPMAAVMALGDWKICGQYDFANVRTLDRHYLLVRPDLAEQVCQATGREPETVDAVYGTALVARHTEK